MFLKKLTISDDSGKIYREVFFKKGMNIILGRVSDEITSTGIASTNSLGKTTLLRAIDFCFGGKETSFYQDNENKNIFNAVVKDFFETKQPKFQLTLSQTFESTEELLIERVIDLSASRGKVKSYIDGKKIAEVDFDEELKKRVFNFSDSKPTLRQISPKFIRINDEQISNILKFANKFTSDAEYEKIHLFLFGYDKTTSLEKKSQFEQRLRSKEKDLAFLNKGKSVSHIQQTLSLLTTEKNELEEKRGNYEIDESRMDSDRISLEAIQNELNSIGRNISEVTLDLHASEQRLSRLKGEHVSKSSAEIQMLYDEAKHYTKNLATTFDELVQFHNSMLQGEIDYLENKIIQLKERLESLSAEKSNSVEEYNVQLKKLGLNGSLAEYTRLSNKIEKLSEDIGRNDAWLTDLNNCEKELDELKAQFDLLRNDFDDLAEVDENLKKFNEYFSKYSYYLYGQKYLISQETDKSKKLIKFSIDAMAGNEGSGHKQGVIAAFDLAYIAYSNFYNLYRPKFAMQDKAELVDVEKWKLLFELANKENGQFIAPFIYDKLSDDYDSIKSSVILELSQNNKFFGI